MALGKLNLDQKKVLAEFCGNFAVAWLAAGVIGPVLTFTPAETLIPNLVASLVWSSILLAIMLSLTGRIK